MGCGHANSLFDRIRFVRFYCLPAFVGARSHQQQQRPPPLLTPTPSNQPANPASRVSVQRAAAEDTPGAAAARTQDSVIQRPPAGRCDELERVFPALWFPTPGPRPPLWPLLEVVRGLRSTTGNPTLIYLSGSAWRQLRSRANKI